MDVVTRGGMGIGSVMSAGAIKMHGGSGGNSVNGKCLRDNHWCILSIEGQDGEFRYLV